MNFNWNQVLFSKLYGSFYAEIHIDFFSHLSANICSWIVLLVQFSETLFSWKYLKRIFFWTVNGISLMNEERSTYWSNNYLKIISLDLQMLNQKTKINIILPQLFGVLPKYCPESGLYINLEKPSQAPLWTGLWNSNSCFSLSLSFSSAIVLIDLDFAPPFSKLARHPFYFAKCPFAAQQEDGVGHFGTETRTILFVNNREVVTELKSNKIIKVPLLHMHHSFKFKNRNSILTHVVEI